MNGEIKDDTPLGRLMSDFAYKEAKNMHYSALADRVKYWKESEEGVSAMCETMEKLAAKAAAEGRAEGKAEGQITAIRNLMQNMKMTIDQAFAALGISGEDQERYRPLVMA